MKQAKRVTKRSKRPQTIAKMEASAEPKRASRYLPGDLAAFYRPIKKPVTLRVDADVLAWFQRSGRGYQTRINRALRNVMMDERKKARE